MEKSEKRYFKVYAKRYSTSKNRHIKLYDAITKLEEYDESVLLKSAGFIRPEQLPTFKQSLHLMLLRALSEYHTSSSVDAQLWQLMHQAEILYDKLLFSQCHKLLSKAKKIARKYEKNIQLLDILFRELDVLHMLSIVDDKDDVYKARYMECNKILKMLSNLNEFERLESATFILLNSGDDVRGGQLFERFKRILNDPLMADPGKALSFKARSFYFKIRATCMHFIGSDNEAYKSAKDRVDHLAANEHMLKEYANHYVTSLSHFAESARVLRKFDEMEEALKKMRKINVKSKQVQCKIFLHSYETEISHYITTGQYEKGLDVVEDILSGFDKYKGEISEIFRLMFHWNFACLYFLAGDHSTSLYWINRILNEPKDFRVNIQCYAWILNLIIHYELGNEELLPYIVKSTYRFLYKRERLFKVETAVLNFIRQKIPNLETEEGIIEAFKELRDDLSDITKVPLERQALDYFDLVSWLESKIESRPFAEVVRSKTLGY